MSERGFCECGCGGKAPIAPASVRKKGHVKGEPMRFIHNHHDPYDPANTYVYGGTRYCRTCKIEKQRKRREAARV